MPVVYKMVSLWHTSYILSSTDLSLFVVLAIKARASLRLGKCYNHRDILALFIYFNLSPGYL